MILLALIIKQYLLLIHRRHLRHHILKKIIEAIKDRYQDIRKNLSRLTSVRGYTEQVSAIHEDAYNADDEKVTELRNMFTAKTFDESLEEVLPLISQILEYFSFLLFRL